MREVLTVNGEGFTSTIYENDSGKCWFLGDYDVDVDGSGSSHGDKYYQPDTSLHREGKALNSDKEYFIVVPGKFPALVEGIVLGCKARVTYNGKSLEAVVGDIGPTKKTGEGSYALAVALGIPPSPVNGGIDDPEVLYEFWPGVVAPTYKLQSS